MSDRITNSNYMPLDGIRALELAEIWAGPFCGLLMGDMGAEIIKVEAIQRIGRGPIAPKEGSAGYPEGDPGKAPWNRQGMFNAVNRNKLGITLDLGSEEGKEMFLDLVNISDVVFTNYSNGVMERLGLGYDTLRKVRPAIIVLFTPGYGNSGPYRNFRSMGMAIDAISGHSSLRGYPDEELNTNSLVHHPDAVAAATASFAISAALYNRTITGKGQFIDLSQAEAFAPHMGEMFLEYQMTGKERSRRGNSHPVLAPHGCYRCEGEDKWITIAIESDTKWAKMCEIMNAPSLAINSKFSTTSSRQKNKSLLDKTITEWTSTRDRYKLFYLLQEAGIASGPVLNSGEDAYQDPHLQERQYFQVVSHPEAGVFPLSGPIWRYPLKDPQDLPHNPAPTLGQHNSYILSEVLGLPNEDMEILAKKDIIGTDPLLGSDMGGIRRLKSEK